MSSYLKFWVACGKGEREKVGRLRSRGCGPGWWERCLPMAAMCITRAWERASPAPTRTWAPRRSGPRTGGPCPSGSQSPPAWAAQAHVGEAQGVRLLGSVLCRRRKRLLSRSGKPDAAAHLDHFAALVRKGDARRNPAWCAAAGTSTASEAVRDLSGPALLLCCSLASVLDDARRVDGRGHGLDSQRPARETVHRHRRLLLLRSFQPAACVQSSAAHLRPPDAVARFFPRAHTRDPAAGRRCIAVACIARSLSELPARAFVRRGDGLYGMAKAGYLPSAARWRRESRGAL